MFNSPWRAIIWSGIFVLMLLSLISPFRIFTVSFMILPVLLLYMTLDRRSFVIHIAIALGIVLVMTSGAGIVMIAAALFFIVPAVVIGELYQRGYPTQFVVLASIIVMIAILLLMLAVTSLFGMQLVAEISQMLRDMYGVINEIMPGQYTDEMIDAQIQLITTLIPSYIMMIALYYALITHWLGRKLLRKIGIDIVALPPVRNWTLPRSVVWVYIGLFVLTLFTGDSDPQILTMILYNLFPILSIALCVQGISLLFFISYHKRVSKLLPIGGVIASLYMTPLVSMIGVFDILLDMRKRIKGDRS